MKKTMILFCAGAALLAAGAAEFPAAVDGTITLDLAEGVTNTYSSALPAATAFVKTGPGCAILTAATTAFTGSVDVREGTLTLKDRMAVGENTPISVTGDAATLNCNFARPSGSGQKTCFFSGHNVTIRGKGVDGKGAFRYTALDSKASDDSMLESLTLSGDAYIGIPSRWGIQKALNLKGHTLTRIDGGATWMWFNSGATIDAGVISNVTGVITPQNVPQFTDPENTTIYMAGGSLEPYSASPVIPCRVVMCGGALSGGGKSSGRNVFSGPVDVTADLNVNPKSGVSLTGPITVGANWVNVRGSGTFFLNGPVTVTNGKSNLRTGDGGRLVLSSNVTRRVALLSMVGAKPRIDLQDGTLECSAFYRGANSGDSRTAFFQSGGAFSVSGDSILGESSNTYSCYQMSGGTATFSNQVWVAYKTGAEGLLVQTGGTLRLRNWGCLMFPAGRGLVAVMGCATNDTRINRFGNVTRIHLGYSVTNNSWISGVHGGRATFAVCGEHAVATTEGLTMGAYDSGATNIVSTNVLAITDGGTFKARRLRARMVADAAMNDVYVDGGIVMPTQQWAWNDASPRSAALRWSIGPKGMVLDTSELEGNEVGENLESEGNRLTINLNFSDATGQGIASIALPTDDATFAAQTYRGPVFVDIEGPGRGASAFAAFDPDTGKLTGVVVLAAGSDYDETTRVYVRHPGVTGRTECAYTLTGPRAGGTLTKRGAYYAKISSTNTYTGGTVVEGGALQMGSARAFPSNTPLTVKAGATFNAGGFDLAVSWLGGMGGTVSSLKDGAMTVSAGLELTAADVFAEGAAPLTVNGKVTFEEGAALRVVDSENLAAHRKGASVAFLKATGGFAGAVPRLELADDTGTRWTTFARGNALYLSPITSTVFILR